MFVNIDKNIILNIFGVDTFYGLEKVLDNMSPSLVEYHLSNFLDSDNSSYFDKKKILKLLLILVIIIYILIIMIIYLLN